VDQELRSHLQNYTLMEPRENKFIGTERPSISLRTESDAKSIITSKDKVKFINNSESKAQETINNAKDSTRGKQKPPTDVIPESKHVLIQRKKPDELKLPTPIMVMGMMKVRQPNMSTTRSLESKLCPKYISFVKSTAMYRLVQRRFTPISNVAWTLM
jgi:hypothetical protein